MTIPAANNGGWRAEIGREDRVKICQHIMGKLASYYHMVPEQALREKTSAFESQAYTNADSRTDYLKRIAGGLSNVERQMQQVTSALANIALPQANGTETTTNDDWRLVMSREDRIKVCQHIMGKLASYYHMVPEQALREKTSAFESQAYTNADSRTDYLKRIAGGLSNVERQVQQATSANANIAHPQADETATILEFFNNVIFRPST